MYVPENNRSYIKHRKTQNRVSFLITEAPTVVPRHVAENHKVCDLKMSYEPNAE